MIYPSNTDLSTSYFVEAKSTYDVNEQYPNTIKAIQGVFIKNFHFDFWKVISPYLPKDSYISNAYVQPEMQAKVGLDLLVANVSNVSLEKYKTIKTNPELIGMYGTHYLFEFNYSSIKDELALVGIKWSKPNCSIHQRGLALDITSSKIDIVISIIQWFITNNNNFCNLSGVIIKQSTNKVHIEFNESSIINESSTGNTVIFNNSISKAVESTLKGKESRYYEILKANGHANLEDSAVPKHVISGLPLKARRQNFFLAKAINEILIDALGGSNGLISKVVQEEIQYVLGLTNGTVGALKCLGVELDTLTNGRASRVVREAIESEAVKTSHYVLIKNKLKKFDPIYDYEDSTNPKNTKKDGDSLAVADSVKIRESITKAEISNITLASSNLVDSMKDTKNTPNNNEKEYDLSRNTEVSDVVILTYDHYLEFVSTDVVSNNSYVVVINNETTKIITHNLNSSNITVSFIDSDGNVSFGGYEIVNNDTINVKFSSKFSGKVTIQKI